MLSQALTIDVLRNYCSASRSQRGVPPDLGHPYTHAGGREAAGAPGDTFLASTLPGLAAAIAFYGQSIARPIPGTDGKPALDEIDDVRMPLLLVFGGHDEQIGPTEIATIRDRLTAQHVHFEIEVYPEVGHSFFREDLGTIATRQIADAWGRVQSFLRRSLA